MPTLPDAIAAIKAGRLKEGRVMLARILAADDHNVTALLWMTEVARTPEELRTFLERVLAIDPTNASARKGLELLNKANEQPSLVATHQPSPEQPALTGTTENHQESPDERRPHETTRLCPFCQKTILADSSFCRFCGRALVATAAAELAGIPANNASNVDTMTGIIIVCLISCVLFWSIIGFSQLRTAYVEIMPAHDVTAAGVQQSLLLTLASVFSFALAVASLVVIQGVMQHQRRAYRQLLGLTGIGGVGAFILAVIGSPAAMLGVPLCIIVAYLAITNKETFGK